MKGRMRSGKIINGRLAEIFVSRGIAVEVKSEADKKQQEVITNEINSEIIDTNNEVVKRTRRTKAEIEASKKK